MALLRAAAAAGLHARRLQGPCLLSLLRRFASGATNDAVERAIVVDTLAQVRLLQHKARFSAAPRTCAACSLVLPQLTLLFHAAGNISCVLIANRAAPAVQETRTFRATAGAGRGLDKVHD